MISKMKKLNYPLIIGGIVIVILTLMTYYPEWFTHKDPTYEEQPKYVEMKVDGVIKEKFLTSPMPPNKENIFGTDDAGRDIYARLIYGTRNTLRIGLLVGLLRMLLAIPMGIGAGMGIKGFSWLIKILNTVFTAIPMLIVSFLILNIQYFKNLPIDKSINAFVIVLTVVGFAKVAGIIEDTTKVVMAEDFIEGEIAVGKSKVQIAYQNVLPHIIPNSISIFFKEFAMALFLLAQLSVLGVFVGLVRQVEEYAFKASYVMNLEPEWGGMLSKISRNVKGFENTYWMVLYPIVFFSIAIIGINLTGEGLRIEFQKKNSKFVSTIKRAGEILSLKIFISQLKKIKIYYKPVIAKVTVMALVIIIFTVQWRPSLYKFDLDMAKNHLQELTSEKYEGRVPGTKGSYDAGEYIIKELKSYGYEIETFEVPLMYDEYYKDENGEEVHATGPNYLAPNLIKSGEIKVINNHGEEQTFKLHEDFTMVGYGYWGLATTEDGRLQFKGTATTMENIEQIENIDSGFESPEIFIMEEGYYGINELVATGYSFFEENKVTLPSGKEVKIEFNKIIFPSGKEVEYRGKILLQEGYDFSSNAYNFSYPVIVPFEELREILKDGFKEIELTFDKPEKMQQGRMITAFLPGEGKEKNNPGEVVVIGAPYDGVYGSNLKKPFAMSAAPAAIALETARNLALARKDFDKSVQFIFWDNEMEYMEQSSVNSSQVYCKDSNKAVEMSNKHGYYYFDITYPGFKKDKKLNVLNSPGPRQGNGNYITGLEMQKRLKELDAKINRLNKGDPVSNAFNAMELNSILSVSLGNYNTEQINSNGGADSLENINYRSMKDIGQIIIDTMTMNPYLKDSNKE